MDIFRPMRLAPIATLIVCLSALTGRGASEDYFCPPGAKFCPAPGADNQVAIDTHFGLDAATGEIRAYPGTEHPDEVSNPPMTGEAMLYASPPLSVENRYVPPSGGDETLAPRKKKKSESGQVIKGRFVPGLRSSASSAPKSEVANNQASRVREDREPTQADRVPWYKGGMWRNRKSAKSDGGKAAPKTQAAAPAAGRTSSVPRAEDDIWGGNDDYDGYNDGGGYSPRQPVQAQGYGDPYAQPQTRGAYAAQPSGFVSDPYTLPDSPPASSPYQPGYVYPGTSLSYDAYQSAPPPQTYNAPPPAQPYAPPAQYGGGDYMPPPPGRSAPVPAAEMSLGPQFENAVRLVKENRFSEARTILAGETSRNPGSASAWRWLGDCQYNLLELETAIGSYERALALDPNDYYALRGHGFALLHRGHEFWRKMQDEVSRGQKEQGAATFSQAHDNYKRALEQLEHCLRRAPNDGEAIYGEAMAAEGASRKLYSNAISYLKLGPENRERAEIFAENCLKVINMGIERSRERARSQPGESGPRALLGGLYLRKAILYQQLGKQELALIEVKNAYDMQKSILDEIDKNNVTAQRGVKECENYWNSWGGGGRQL